MLRDNTGQNGSLNTDSFLAALLNHRNTPAADTGMSPSEVIFGRKLKDFIPILPRNLKMNPEWNEMMDQREKALAKRHQRRGEVLSEHTRVLKILSVGTIVAVQNQYGRFPLRWDRTGRIVEVGNFDQYTVRMDGTGRLTTRNRRFLRPIQPYRDVIGRVVPTQESVVTQQCEEVCESDNLEIQKANPEEIVQLRRSERV